MVINLQPMLASHSSILTELVQEGFRSYHTRYAAYAADHSKVARAALINSHMVNLAKEQLPPRGFKYVEMAGRCLFSYRGEVVLQFKKLSHRMMPSNYLTPLCRSLYLEGEIDGLPGIPSQLPLITVGYVPDEFWRHSLGVFAVHVVGMRPALVQRLDASKDTQTELPIPINDHAATQPRTRKARLKTAGVPERGETGASDSGDSAQARAG